MVMSSGESNNYTYKDFMSDYEDGEVESITLYQNKEVPTGKLVVKLDDGTKHSICFKSMVLGNLGRVQ